MLAAEFDLDAAVARLRGAAGRWLGEALQDQRLVAGIGNMWMAEALWEIQVSPWARVRDVSDETLRDALAAARRLMQASLDDGPLAAAGSTGTRAGRALAAARSSARADRATTTGRRTGVRAARQEAGRRGSKQDGWRYAHRNCTSPCAPSVSARSSSSAVRSRKATTCPFSFEEHVQRGGPALYEYRPLVRTFVESRASALAGREDARIALDELLREPAAAIFARAHAGPKPSEEQALFRTVLVSLLISTAEACGGFDWDDRAFEPAYAEFEHSLFGASRAYAAVAPLVGISVVTQVELGGGIRMRAAATGELAHHWPEAQGLLPPGSAVRSTAAACSSSRVTWSPAPSRPTRRPSSPTRSPRSGWPPLPRSPPAPCCSSGWTGAVRDPAGASDRGDAAAGRGHAPRLVPRRAQPRAPHAPLARRRRRAARRGARPLGALALPERAVPVGAAARRARGLLGDTWELRAAVLLGDASDERRAIHASLRSLASGEQASERAEDAVRRSLVEVLRHGDRPALVRSLDDVLLGLRSAPRLAHTA